DHGKRTLVKVIEYDAKAGAIPVFWESEKVVDIFWTFVREEANAGNERAKEWINRFSNDKYGAAKEYWNRFLGKLEELTGAKWSK
ncbi:MAG: glyceraldehyde-3-phosphate:ferredoxin oxidoreductase, partial [Thermoprotei archaeon]|nr:glyceraldehyde-3-phosphate:ferredoxin oxidoreductase [Thermoprotei archaeon]